MRKKVGMGAGPGPCLEGNRGGARPILVVVAALCLWCAGLWWGAASLPAATLWDVYPELKAQYPGYLQQLVDQGVTEAQIEAFVRDLSAELEKDPPTAANLTSHLVEKALSLVGKHAALYQAAVRAFPTDWWEAYQQHQLPEALRPIRDLLRERLLAPPPTSGGSGGGGGGGGGSGGAAASTLTQVKDQITKGVLAGTAAVTRLREALAGTAQLTADSRAAVGEALRALAGAGFGRVRAEELARSGDQAAERLEVPAPALSQAREEVRAARDELRPLLAQKGALDQAGALPDAVGVSLPAPAGSRAVVLPAEQLRAAGGQGLDMVLDAGSVALRLPAAALAAAPAGGTVELAYRAAALPADAQPAEGLRLAGSPVELSLSWPGGGAPGAQLQLRLSYRAGADPALLAVYRFDEAGRTWVRVGGTVDAASRTVTVSLDHLSTYAVLEERVAFADMAGHWAAKEVAACATLGLVRGVGGNRFEPDRFVTRAEFAALLVRVAGLAEDPSAAGVFSDVASGDWYAGVVGAAYGAGLVRGVGSGRFDPQAPVTREQVATMLFRLLAGRGLAVPGPAAALERFRDRGEIADWARDAVAFGAQTALLKGRAADEFAPAAATTRAEAAVLAYRCRQRLAAR